MQALSARSGLACEAEFFVTKDLYKEGPMRAAMTAFHHAGLCRGHSAPDDLRIEHVIPLGAPDHIRLFESLTPPIDPNDLSHLAFFCMPCANHKDAIEAQMMRAANRAAAPGQGQVHWYCGMKFCVACDSTCTLSPRGNPYEKY